MVDNHAKTVTEEHFHHHHWCDLPPPTPPVKDGPIIAHITRSLEFLLQRYPAAGVLLLGDFNKMRTSRVTGSFHLKQIVDKPTRKGAILDKILTNMADFYPTPEICSHLGKSDHNIITAIPCLGTTWKHRPCSQTIKTTRHVTTETKRTFAAALTAINWSSLYHLSTCQEQFDAFMSVLNSLIEEHFPTTTAVRHSNDKPWVTKGFKALAQDRQRALHEGDTETYRRLRNKINRQRSRLREKFYQSKVDKIGESNSRQWWKTIKTMIGLQPPKSHLCDLADQLCGGDTLALANNINRVFKEVTSDLQPLPPAAASADHDVPDEFIISVTDCEQKLSKLSVHKAMGADNIPNWILKDFSYILASPIAAIYNSSVRQSYVPPSWKQAEILPNSHPKSPTGDITGQTPTPHHSHTSTVQGAGVVCRVLDEGSNRAQ